MIQRMQTLHLLIVMGLVIAMLFPNFATIETGGIPQRSEEVTADGTHVRTTRLAPDYDALDAWGVYQNGVKRESLPYMTSLIILTAAVAFITVFLYRKRRIQIRMCFVLAVLLLGITLYIAMYLYRFQDIAGGFPIKYSIVDVFPLIGMIFVYLAYRGIIKDEALVRSLDRLR